jgi:hypothetical protein
MNQADINRRLQQLVDERGVSVRALARATQFDHSYLGKILRGKRPLSSTVAAALDTALASDGELTRLVAAGDEAAEHVVQGINYIVSSAATDASQHAELAEASGIGPGALEQFRSDVVRLARAYVITPPYPLFVEMDEVRRRILNALSRPMRPQQTRELYVLVGSLCALMANASLDLGSPASGDSFARAAWTYGTIADHAGLMSWARGTQALIAMIDGRLADAIDYAHRGLAVQQAGMGGARLHAINARILAASGRADDAKGALKKASVTSDQYAPADLHGELGGEFAFDMAKRRYYEAITYVQIGHANEGEAAARAAIDAFEERPPHERSYGCEALARLQLSLARIKGGELEGVSEALEPILELAPERRITSIVLSFSAISQLLRQPRFRGSGAARELDEYISAFCNRDLSRALLSG